MLVILGETCGEFEQEFMQDHPNSSMSDESSYVFHSSTPHGRHISHCGRYRLNRYRIVPNPFMQIWLITGRFGAGITSLSIPSVYRYLFGYRVDEFLVSCNILGKYSGNINYDK